MRSGYQSLALLVAVCLCSCGDGAGREQAVAGTALPVCGEGGTGFVALVRGGGQVGAQLFRELGRYVVVDPSCRFTVAESSTSMAVAVEGTLNEEQAEELSAFLALSEWEDLDPVYGASVCDGGSVRFAVGNRVIDIVPFCSVSPIPEPPEDFVHVLGAVPGELASRLRPLGEPVSGPVRYMLGRDGETIAPDPVFQGAPEWPLDAPPDVLSERIVPGDPDTFDPDAYLTSGTLRVWTATGDDAAQLRALRTAWHSGEIRGFEQVTYIPIAHSDGSRYKLILRDVIQFENADGEPSVSWVDLSQPGGPIQP